VFILWLSCGSCRYLAANPGRIRAGRAERSDNVLHALFTGRCGCQGQELEGVEEEVGVLRGTVIIQNHESMGQNLTYLTSGLGVGLSFTSAWIGVQWNGVGFNWIGLGSDPKD
jgi:hypothetical protein